MTSTRRSATALNCEHLFCWCLMYLLLLLAESYIWILACVLWIQRSCAHLPYAFHFVSLISHRWYKDEDIPNVDVWGLLHCFKILVILQKRFDAEPKQSEINGSVSYIELQVRVLVVTKVALFVTDQITMATFSEHKTLEGFFKQTLLFASYFNCNINSVPVIKPSSLLTANEATKLEQCKLCILLLVDCACSLLFWWCQKSIHFCFTLLPSLLYTVELEATRTHNNNQE